MKKILIINPFGIGDVLFTTPLISAIKSDFPGSVIYYWCNRRVKDVLLNNPKIAQVFALSRGDLKKIYAVSRIDALRQFFALLARIKKEKFDTVFDFSLDHRYGVITFLLGIKKRIGFNYKKRGFFLTDKITIEGYSDKHAAAHYLDLLQFAGKKCASRNLEIFSSQTDKIRVKILLEQIGIGENDIIVAIAPGAGASWGESASLKHWSPIKYAKLADVIMEKYKARVLILGDAAEKDIADIIASAMKNKAVNLTGKTSLGELTALLSNARLLITNDGGPLHIGVALGIKTVSVFGPVDERVYGPYPESPRHIVIKKDCACRPCYKNFRMEVCNNNRECINSIGVEEVFNAVEKHLR